MAAHGVRRVGQDTGDILEAGAARQQLAGQRMAEFVRMGSRNLGPLEHHAQRTLRALHQTPHAGIAARKIQSAILGCSLRARQCFQRLQYVGMKLHDDLAVILESGHAVIAWVLGLCVLRVSIVGQGTMGGFCVVGTAPDEDVPEIVPAKLLSDRQLSDSDLREACYESSHGD